MPLFSKNSPGSPLMPPPSREYIAKARASPPKKLAPLALPSADISDDAAKVPRGKIEMQPALLAEFAGLIDAIGPAICQLLPGEAGLAKGLQHIFKAVVDAAGGSLEAVACLLKELSTGHLFDGIKHFLSNIATTVGCTLDEVYQAVQALLGGVEDLTGSIGEIVECILKNVGELLSEIKKGVVALLKCILPTKLFASIEALVGGILREVSSLVDLRCLFENIEHLLCTVFSAVRFLLQNVASIVFTILCDTKKVVDGVLVATGKVVSDAMGLVKEVLGDVFRLVRHALCEVAVFLRGLFGGVSGFLCHLLLDIEQLLCSILGGPHHCLGAVDKIGCAIGKVFPAIEQSALCLFGHIQRKGVDSKGALKLCLHEVSGNFLCDLFTELKGFLEMVAKAVGCTLSDVFAAVRMILNGVACETSKIVSYILANVGCLLDGIKKAVVCLLKKVLPAGLFCSIEKLLSTILCSVANLVDLRKLFRGIWGLVGEVLCFTKFLLAGVGCLVREILTESGELVNGVLCKTGKVVHNTLELVKEVVGDALCYVHGLLEKVGCFVEELLGSIDTFLCWLFTEVSKLVGAILHGVSWILGQVNKIFPAICALLPGIDGIVSDILSGVACVVQDELDQVKLLLEAIGCAVAKILKPIRCFLEFIAKEVGCTVKEVFCAVKALLCGVGGLVGKTLKIVQCILANVGRLVQDVLAGVVLPAETQPAVDRREDRGACRHHPLRGEGPGGPARPLLQDRGAAARHLRLHLLPAQECRVASLHHPRRRHGARPRRARLGAARAVRGPGGRGRVCVLHARRRQLPRVGHLPRRHLPAQGDPLP